MTESLNEKYTRLLREGRTSEATIVARKARYGNEEEPDNSGSKEENELEQNDEEGHMVYTQLNGVGEELAEEFFEEFGDWSSFVEDVSKERLVDVSGIGEARADSLLEQVKE